MKIQILRSEYLNQTYSQNAKINSILRTLVALNGKSGLWTAVSEYVSTPEAACLSADEIWELYQTTKWVTYGY
jgi:hypothetical protein